MPPAVPLHVLVAILEPSTRFEEGRWPLHVTVVPTFTPLADENTIRRALQRVADHTRPFMVTATEAAMFGPKADMRVRKVVGDEIVAAHRAFSGALHDLVSFNEPDYSGEGYMAHVTDQDDAGLSAGESRRVDSVSLVRLERAGPEIAATFGLNELLRPARAGR